MTTRPPIRPPEPTPEPTPERTRGEAADQTAERAPDQTVERSPDRTRKQPAIRPAMAHDAAVAVALAEADVSTAGSETSEAVAGLISHAVMDAARRIEGDLFRSACPKARLMLAPGLDRSQGAILAVDGCELVIGATRAARPHFGRIGDLARKPVPAADLPGLDSPATLEEGERAVLARADLARALARAGGNASAAARALSISRATFHRKPGRKT